MDGSSSLKGTCTVWVLIDFYIHHSKEVDRHFDHRQHYVQVTFLGQCKVSLFLLISHEHETVRNLTGYKLCSGCLLFPPDTRPGKNKQVVQLRAVSYCTSFGKCGLWLDLHIIYWMDGLLFGELDSPDNLNHDRYNLELKVLQVLEKVKIFSKLISWSGSILI